MNSANINVNTYFLCADGNGQVMEWNLENGWDDCADGSDELLDAAGALEEVRTASRTQADSANATSTTTAPTIIVTWLR